MLKYSYMKIIDTTTYFEEKMMMDLRFNILDPYIYKFIVCEARFTHSGKKKEINFNKKDYPKFEDKIIHLIVDNQPEDIIVKEKMSSKELRLNSISRIKYQRNFIMNSLKDFSSDDYVIYSDNDEIPNLDNFDFKSNKEKIIMFNQKLFYYKFNLGLPSLDWYGSKACKIKNLKNIDLLRHSKNKKYSFYRFDTIFSDIKHQSVNLIKNGGWHFSNFKTIEELERKYLNDENHSEYESQGHSMIKIQENVKNRYINYNHKAKKKSNERFNHTKLETIEKSSLPKYLINNLDKYKNWFV